MDESSTDATIQAPEADISARQIKESPVVQYRRDLSELLDEIKALTMRWRWMSLVRGVAFLLALGLLIAGFATVWDTRTTWFVLSGIVFLIFLYVAYVHEGIENVLRKSRIQSRLLTEDIARFDRRWEDLAYRPAELPHEFQAVSNDLDLFGRSSLFQMIGCVQTPLGVEQLEQSILQGLPVDQIEPQQRAVAELRDSDEFRERLRFMCHLLAASEGGPSSLLAWAESEPQVDRSGILNWIARTLTLLMAILLAAMLSGAVSLIITGPTFLALFAVNFLMTVLFAGRIHGVFNQVATHHREIDHYLETLRLVSGFKPESQLLTDLHQEMFGKNHDVLTAISSLGRVAWLANLRRHGILFLAYLMLQFLFMWDFHVLWILKSWRRKNGQYVRSWLNDLGKWEVTGALGKLAKDHPDWTFPTVKNPEEKQSARIFGSYIGHPLLPNDSRVCNSVEVGPAGSVLLVTGSNMSGKSTLLRAIGLNVVLAQMGSVVCASELRMPRLRIETSMRIQDSLADGVSFFMAELMRLKEVVDIAERYQDNNDVTLLFLLDEILQGTNSRERHIAVSRVVRHLIDFRAIGAVSTHDLELGQTDELKNSYHAVHFRESFVRKNGKKTMTFDYQMHPGIATTTNALELLKIVGLDDD